jgi:predicted negative regulator of RcsB-dependent stress response
VEHIARLRLGRVLLSGGEGERALALVPPQAPAGYQSDYLELKGDALAVLGRRAEALAAYQEAAKLARAGGVSPTLTLKLEELSAAAGSAP